MSRKMLRRQSRREKAASRLNIKVFKIGQGDFGGILFSAPDLKPDMTAAQHESLMSYGYLHSTLVGFQTEYDQYIAGQQLLQQITKLKYRAKADLYSAITELDKRSTPELVEAVWGKRDRKLSTLASVKIPNLDQYEVANYLLTQTPGGQAAVNYLAAYETFLTQYNKIYKNNGQKPYLNSLLQAPKTLKNAAIQIRNAALHLYKTALQYIKVMQQSDPSWQPYTKNDTYIKALQTLINENYTDLSVIDFKSTLRILSQYFGYRAEDIREIDLLERVKSAQAIKDKIQAGDISNIQAVHGGSELSDLTFTVMVPGITPKPVRVGASVKLRTYDNFEIHAKFNADSTNKTDPKKNKGAQFFKELIYLYRNILALTTFARDKEIGVGKSNNARFNNILHGLAPSTAEAIQVFREFAIYRALLTAFFGNSVDAGKKTNLFDPHFYDNIVKNYEGDGETAPPVYLITGRHVYRSADILTYYLQPDKLKKLMVEGQSEYRFTYTSNELRNLWEAKRDVLLAGTDQESIYDILLHNINAVTKDRANSQKFQLEIKRILRL